MQNYKTRTFDKDSDRVTVDLWTSEDNKKLPGANVGHVAIETAYEHFSLIPLPRPVDEQIPSSTLSVKGSVKRRFGHYFNPRSPKYISSYLFDTVMETIAEDDAIEIKHINELAKGQIAILLNEDTFEMRHLTTQPDRIEPNETMLAIEPTPANIRLSFYSLDKGKISAKFNDIKYDCPGWRLIGSNALSRALSETPLENCASLAYRLLQAGHFDSLLDKTKSSSFSSEASVVARPDNFVKYLVAAKVEELRKYAATSTFTRPDDTDIDDLKVLYGFSNQQQNARKLFVKSA